MKSFCVGAVCVLALTVVVTVTAQTNAPDTSPSQATNPFELVKEGVDKIAKEIWPVAIAMAAVGTLAMALIQAAKDIFGARQRFQSKYLRGWLKTKGQSFLNRARGFASVTVYAEKRSRSKEIFNALPEGDIFTADPKKAEEDLIRLATSEDKKAFYDLPIEQLAGQMNAAVQAALDYPLAHRDLLWCLAHLAEPEDIIAVLAPPRDLLERDREKLSDPEKKIVDDFVAARNRLTHQVQRAIDALQIAAGAAWKRRMQIWSMGLSAVLGVLALYVATRTLDLGPSAGMFVMTGVLAGLLAPVARDLVAALQSLRK